MFDFQINLCPVVLNYIYLRSNSFSSFILRYFNKILLFDGQKRPKKRDPLQLFAEKVHFSNKKKRPKREPKSGLGLLRDPGLPKRDPVGSSALYLSQIPLYLSQIPLYLSQIQMYLSQITLYFPRIPIYLSHSSCPK